MSDYTSTCPQKSLKISTHPLPTLDAPASTPCPPPKSLKSPPKSLKGPHPSSQLHPLFPLPIFRHGGARTRALARGSADTDGKRKQWGLEGRGGVHTDGWGRMGRDAEKRNLGGNQGLGEGCTRRDAGGDLGTDLKMRFLRGNQGPGEGCTQTDAGGDPGTDAGRICVSREWIFGCGVMKCLNGTNYNSSRVARPAVTAEYQVWRRKMECMRNAISRGVCMEIPYMEVDSCISGLISGDPCISDCRFFGCGSISA
jgi:hypothetical protein